MMHRFHLAWFLACFLLFSGSFSYAQDVQLLDTPSENVTHLERVSLARDFLSRMRQGFSKAEKFLDSREGDTQVSQTPNRNILPEGEELLFQVTLTRRLRLESAVFGRVVDGQVLLSLRDLVSALEFPIQVDAQSGTAQGWYIREHKAFSLDLNEKVVQTAEGTFTFSASAQDQDIFVPVGEVKKWFGFTEIIMDVSGLQLLIIPSQPLPIQERMERAQKRSDVRSVAEAVLPVAEQKKQLIDVPFVDVATTSRYTRRRSSPPDTSHTMNVRTAGDFAYGTLMTQTQMNDEDQITNIRANYKQESLEPDLLGPLKARRFEAGDVIQTRLPIDAQVRQELGVRVTNADSLRSLTNPSTAISGTVFPGWDVELYRGNQFIGVQRVGDDGFYSFDDVILFNDENVFRVVFYGPQGEIREEEISIPVDVRRLAEGRGVYDVSLTFDGKQTYRKLDLDDEDEGSPTVMALYEKPLAPGTVGALGLRSSQQSGERNTVVYGGISKVLKQTLLNANLGLDDDADMAAELVARRNIGDHDLVSTTRFFTDNYDTVSGGNDTLGFFNTRFNANGPLPIGIGLHPRYSASLDYNRDNDGITRTLANLGFNTAYKNFTFNEQFNYTSTNGEADDRLVSVTGITGSFGPNRVRLRSDYDIKPKNQLRRVEATYTHDFSRDLDLDLGVERSIDPSLTSASAQLNWQAGWARISPSIRYNSDNEVFAGLNTNFGLARNPQAAGIRMLDRAITSNGGISVFVFLDENGDGRFNEGEQPLQDVAVQALQNGGRAVTNENGIAFFDRVRELKRTDVVLDEDTLSDPFWVSGFDGASIIPREGYVAELEFPVHVAGEIDGTLYARGNGPEPYALRGIPVHLYNADGEVEQTAVTDLGGFYLFTRVPPGRYLLLVDQKAAKNGHFSRPDLQPIEITYDGTILYGNDIFVEAGQEDIPSTILADLADYKAQHPHINFEGADYNIALNLGDYNSQLLMSTVWYRLHTRYRSLLRGGELMVLPEHSYASVKSGKHTLRVGFRDLSVDEAYKRCQALLAREISCTVEVLPGAAEEKFAMGAGAPG